MFVDRASRLQRPYGVREKSAAAIISVVKRFVADMRVPRAFRNDNGTEYSNSMFVDFQGWTRRATWSSTAVPGHPPGRDPGFYRRGRNEPRAGVATLGIRVLQQGGNISERGVAFPP